MSEAPHDEAASLLTWDDLAAIADWPALFGNSNPVEIEVGSGKGLFLLTAGAERQGTNFLGIERSRKYARIAARRVAKHCLSNVRVLVADARVVFTQWVADQSVLAVHVYFPDPWWKRRHKKRRALTPSFLGDVERVLVARGQLHVWTDVEEYFKTTRELVAKHTTLRWAEPPPEHVAEHDMDYRTHYERKMRRRGRRVFRARYARTE